MGLNACQSSWLQPFITKSKCYDCEMLHWAWQGVSSFALKRAMTLASTNPHEMLSAETTAGAVSLLQSNCGNDRQSWDSMRVSPAGCSRSLQNQNVVIVKGCTGHGRVCTGLH